MLDFEYVVEQALYDNTVRKLLGDPTSAFWGDGFLVQTVAGMQVKITAGSGYVYDSTELDPDVATFKPVVAPSDINVTVNTADGSLQRIDLICVKTARFVSVTESRVIADVGVSYPPTTTNQTVDKKNSDYRDYTYVSGTPGAGAPAIPAGYTKIATITVDAGATSITSDKIEDNRTVARVPSTYVAVQAAGNLSSVILQNALEELQVDIDGNAANLSSHVSSSTAHPAAKITFVPGGDPNFGGATNVQGALVNLSSIVGVGGLAAHLADPTDAHDASAISVVPFTGIASTDVQAALEEELDRFGVEHVKTTGAHGPTVSINNTTTATALTITTLRRGLIITGTSTSPTHLVDLVNYNTSSALDIVQNSAISGGSVLHITSSAAAGRGLQINLSGTGNTDYGILIDTASASGNDIRGTNDNWRVDSKGVAAFGNVTVGGANTGLGFLRLATGATLTIASGVITATNSFHEVDTEAAAASDNLDTINGAVDGNLLIITNVNAARTITARDGIGNLRLQGNFAFTDNDDRLTLLARSGNWYEISRSNNA